VIENDHDPSPETLTGIPVCKTRVNSRIISCVKGAQVYREIIVHSLPPYMLVVGFVVPGIVSYGLQVVDHPDGVAQGKSRNMFIVVPSEHCCGNNHRHVLEQYMKSVANTEGVVGTDGDLPGPVVGEYIGVLFLENSLEPDTDSNIPLSIEGEAVFRKIFYM